MSSHTTPLLEPVLVYLCGSRAFVASIGRHRAHERGPEECDVLNDVCMSIARLLKSLIARSFSELASLASS